MLGGKRVQYTFNLGRNISVNNIYIDHANPILKKIALSLIRNEVIAI